MRTSCYLIRRIDCDERVQEFSESDQCRWTFAGRNGRPGIRCGVRHVMGGLKMRRLGAFRALPVRRYNEYCKIELEGGAVAVLGVDSHKSYLICLRCIQITEIVTIPTSQG
jgi:hypothetical protein